jgi:hypothetical protein
MICKYRVDFRPYKEAEFGSGILVYAWDERAAKKRAIKKAKKNVNIPYWKNGLIEVTKIR